MAKSPPRGKSNQAKPLVSKGQTQGQPTNIAVLNDYPDLARAKAKRNSIKDRQSQRFRRRVWYGVVAIALSVSTYGLISLPEWQLKTRKQIEIEGNQLISTSMLKDLIKINFPQSIFAVNPKQIAEHLQESAPVSEVRIRKSLFPARITINLVERKPVARVMIANNLQLIDAEGKLLSPRFYTKPATELKLLVKADRPNHIQLYWPSIYREVKSPELGITLVDWRDPSNLILVNPTLNIHCGFYAAGKFEQQIQKIKQFQVPAVKSRLKQRQPVVAHRINLSNPNAPFLF
ncbi:MAG: FtsQ-type POTRA domain-containing protein [Pseudanabaenaceae cyanobacterium bins.68]|nr:FtsQ-type POTRA domain-containing protein [Pseudanabaenaceae cyanobacterium bins.68]